MQIRVCRHAFIDFDINLVLVYIQTYIYVKLMNVESVVVVYYIVQMSHVN